MLMNNDTNAFLLPSTYSRIIARVAKLQERDLSKLLQGTGLPDTILMPGDETFISGDQQLQIMKNGRELLGSADFGLRLGEQLQPSAHGPLGYLALCSPDLMSALYALRDYLPLRMPWVAVDVSVSQERILCELRLRMSVDDNVFAQITIAECFAMVVQSFVEAVLRRPATEAVIEFAHRSPAHVQHYNNFLHAPYSFDCPRNSYVLPGDLATATNATSDNASYRLTQQLCNTLLEQTPRSSSSMADRVRTLMLLRPVESIGEPEIARALFVSKRTLARRLDLEGTSYRQIRDQFLAELARRYLLEPRQTVETVAASLGYHDAAAFRKAFKRWTGMTPRNYRDASPSVYSKGDAHSTDFRRITV
ncbi:helix-turn-helix- domain containing protein, AraC type [gamma proteobacterium NOR5-3]|nr:helix-turn-helix- domain containing protein, AraC type [gamma proteobacterium NOR5-3]